MIYVWKGCILSVFLTALLVTAFGQLNDVPARNAVIPDFTTRAKEYASQREKLERSIPALPKKATPEQIESHKAALLKAVQADRQGLKQGHIFTVENADAIRAIVKREFQGAEKTRLRTAVFEAENKAVPVRVNVAYPPSQEQLEMPPALLLALPELPKQLRYRFVGQNLLLVDRENFLIVDFMTNALP